jgi:hypothetical protein
MSCHIVQSLVKARIFSGDGGSAVIGLHCDRPPLSESCEGIELTEDTSELTGLGEGEESPCERSLL